MRLVPDVPRALAVDDAREEAKAAFYKAKRAQMALVSHLQLTERLYDPGVVSYYKLKGMQAQAEQQVDRARKVVDALIAAIDAMEAAR